MPLVIKTLVLCVSVILIEKHGFSHCTTLIHSLLPTDIAQACADCGPTHVHRPRPGVRLRGSTSNLPVTSTASSANRLASTEPSY